MIDPITLALMKKMAGSGESGEWAPLNSPNLTGIPTAPTAEYGTSTDQLATTKFVQDALTATIIISISPALENIEITLSNDNKTYQKTTNSTGVAIFRIKDLGDYNILYNTNIRLNSPSMVTVQEIGAVQYINATQIPAKTYTINVDLNNYNSSSAVTYADDATCYSKNDSEWNNTHLYSRIKPCMFKNGEVQYYLDKNNFNYQEDGVTPSDLTGADGDIMIEIPKFGYKITKNATTMTVSITDAENAIDFNYNAFTRDEAGDLDCFYWGAYKGSLINGVLRSLPNQTIASNDTLANFKLAAQGNGQNYSISSFHQLIALQCLYLIKYGNLNGQIAIGNGVTDTNAALQTGGTETAGMYAGDAQLHDQHMKFAGIEDFWGNVWEWVDNISLNNQYQFSTTVGSSVLEYENQLITSTKDGWLNQLIGDSDFGFIGSEYTGSETTYYHDYSVIYAEQDFAFGGSWSHNNKCGPFCLYAFPVQSHHLPHYGARLIYI